MDQIFCSKAIYLKIGFLFDRLGRTCQVEHQIDIPYGLFQRGLIITIASNEFDRKAFQPFQIAGFSKETAHLYSFSNERFRQMASNKSCASGDQSFQ